MRKTSKWGESRPMGMAMSWLEGKWVYENGRTNCLDSPLLRNLFMHSWVPNSSSSFSVFEIAFILAFWAKFFSWLLDGHPCDVIQCFNGGLCVFMGYGTCQCPPGFSGLQCENVGMWAKTNCCVIVEFGWFTWTDWNQVFLKATIIFLLCALKPSLL